MADLYNPQAFVGGGQGPVSGAVAKTGYLSTALNTMNQAYLQKQERKSKQLQDKAVFAQQNLDKARENLKKYGGDPALAEQMKQQEAEAMGELDKAEKEVQRHYGADKTIFSALWDKITGTGGQPHPGSPGNPPAAGGKPGAKGTPPFVPSGATAKLANAPPNSYAAMANIDAAKAVAEGKSEAEIAEEASLTRENNIQKQKDDAVRAVDLKVAQKGYIQAVLDVRNGKPIDDVIAKVAEITQTTFPDDPKALANHIISTVNGALRLPKYANDPEQVKRLNKILSDQYAVLAGESGKAAPKVLALGKTERAAADRTPGFNPNIPLDQQSPEVQAAYAQNISKMTAEEDKVESARLNEIIARAKHLARIGTGSGRKAGTPKNPMDDVILQINRGLNMAFKGAITTDSAAAQAKAEEIAKQVVTGNDALLAQKDPSENYLDFVYRKLGEGVPTAPPVPSGSSQDLPDDAKRYLGLTK